MPGLWWVYVFVGLAGVLMGIGARVLWELRKDR